MKDLALYDPYKLNEVEIKTVIREIGEQVASRLRAKDKNGSVVSLYVGTAYTEESRGFSAQLKIDATNNSKKIVQTLMTIFDLHYEGQAVRNIGVSIGSLSESGVEQMDLFAPKSEAVKETKIDGTIDEIRRKFGTTAIVKLSSLSKSGTMLERANLVGGYNGGNVYG